MILSNSLDNNEENKLLTAIYYWTISNTPYILGYL